MEICSDSHEEIVYSRGKCPLCEALDKIHDLDDEITSLENELAEKD